MKFFLSIISFLILTVSMVAQTIRESQQQYPRVKEAYSQKWDEAMELLREADIPEKSLDVYIRIFKEEDELEIWAGTRGENTHSLISTIPVCSMSGGPGPKRREGDRQVPEGFYKIVRFNPNSNFWLSLGINYPNASDKILSDKQHPGGEIFIHGNCVSIGCIAIRDKNINLLYILCLEAKEAGQKEIPVHIFPCRMEGEAYLSLKRKIADNKDLTNFWADIQPAYTDFEKSRKLPSIKFLPDGTHQISTRDK